jgi:hypothetical protein
MRAMNTCVLRLLPVLRAFFSDDPGAATAGSGSSRFRTNTPTARATRRRWPCSSTSPVHSASCCFTGSLPHSLKAARLTSSTVNVAATAATSRRAEPVRAARRRAQAAIQGPANKGTSTFSDTCSAPPQGLGPSTANSDRASRITTPAISNPTLRARCRAQPAL